ncbi:MAG: GIY-YIG nuclease family protein [Bryobacteraceae bacterium]
MSGVHEDRAARLFPAAPGSYLLVLRLASPQRLSVGALGACEFPAGIYLYCGSALGPGGIRARAGRHLESSERAHWHIDHLLRCARVHEVWIREDPQRLECRWAEALAASGLCECPAPRFGASDCRCRAHLWRLPRSERACRSLLHSLPFPPHLVLAR